MFKKSKTAAAVEESNDDLSSTRAGGKTQRTADQYQSLIFKNKDSYLIEAMEPGCHLEDTLLMRHKVIPQYTDLGPPDLCYLVVEQQKKSKFFQKKPHQVYQFGLYHYVYGVDTSSSACVAACVACATAGSARCSMSATWSWT